MQISEIKIADIADVDLSGLGVTKFGDFTVEVIDPVSDYLELMEVWNKTHASLEFLDDNGCWLDLRMLWGFCAECFWFPAYQKSPVKVWF